MKRYRMFIVILVLLALALWVDMPNSSLNVGNFSRSFETKLGLDLVGGVQALLEADWPADKALPADSMNTARAIVENRVNGLGVSEAVVKLAGERRIVVEIPGQVDPDQAIATIQETGLLEFVHMGSQSLPEGTEIVTDYETGNLPVEAPTPTVITSTVVTPTEVLPAQEVLHTVMTGAALKTVTVSTDTYGDYVIQFALNAEGTQKFAEYTSLNVGQILGIVLDKKVISAPVVRDAIPDGQGIISGNFTLESANKLAIQLRYGSLPIPLKVVESNSVGPTLGQDSLKRSLIAGSIGLAIVIIFMAFYYRLPGMVADLALIVYALLTLALFKLIPVTLTLPGIAGFVLSIGMAVDANILIFSRLKEELRGGRSLRQAIDLGWGRAWPSIRDSNFSTLITCGILFWFGNTFGASIVKGFSITLAIGVIISLFTAITVTRTILHLVLDNMKFAEHPKWFGVG